MSKSGKRLKCSAGYAVIYMYERPYISTDSKYGVRRAGFGQQINS